MDVYFVDTENTWAGVPELFYKAAAGDVFFLFHSAHSPRLSMDVFGMASLRGVDFRFIPCFVGHNAMDFQLCTELGRQINLHPEAGFHIVSKDGGYDSVVKYWELQGKKVNRIIINVHGSISPPPDMTPFVEQIEQVKAKACGHSNPPVSVPPVVAVDYVDDMLPELTPDGEPAAERSVVDSPFLACGVSASDCSVLDEIIAEANKRPSRIRLHYVHCTIGSKFGSDNGRQIRNKIDGVLAKMFGGSAQGKEAVASLVRNDMPDLNQKQVMFCANVIEKARKMQSNCRMNWAYGQFRSSFGQTKGCKVYNKLKSYISS